MIVADDWQPQSKYGNMSYGEKLEINFSLFFCIISYLSSWPEEGFCRVFPAGSKISLSSLSPLEGKGKLYSLTFFGAKKEAKFRVP